MFSKIKNKKMALKERFEQLLLKNMHVTPVMIFVAVLFFGAKIIDILTLQELRDGKESGLVAGEVAQTTADMNNASDINKADSAKKAEAEPSTNLAAVNVDAMTPQKYRLLKEIDQGRMLKSSGDEERIAKKEALEAIEVRVDKKIDVLTKAEKAAKEKVEAEAQKKEEDRALKLKRLIKIAEGFAPKEAAPILEGVDFPILVELMSHIKESKASAILAQMEPQKASYLLSAMGRQLDGHAQQVPDKSAQPVSSAGTISQPPSSPTVVPAVANDKQDKKEENIDPKEAPSASNKDAKETISRNKDNEQELLEKELDKAVGKLSKKKSGSSKKFPLKEKSKEDVSSDNEDQSGDDSAKSSNDKKKKDKDAA
ncbi:MAG: MotE family protein [Candidatus Nucleicultricaceae bacterium]